MNPFTMNYIVFDLEATCWDQYDRSDNETIEIGALLIREGKVISEFERFVKPIKYPKLSDFCKQLTTIEQSEVDKAELFYSVIKDFQDWIRDGGYDYVLCSWGFYDRKQLESDCRLHHLPIDWLEAHISIKHQYTKIMGLRRGLGMAKALIKENLSLTGTHHRGIDDARNIAKIFLRYFGDFDFPA